MAKQCFICLNETPCVLVNNSIIANHQYFVAWFCKLHVSYDCTNKSSGAKSGDRTGYSIVPCGQSISQERFYEEMLILCVSFT